MRLPLFAHIAIWLVLGVLIASACMYLMWVAFGRPRLHSAAGGIDPSTLFDALKIALAFVAGIGGVVALVVAYRRQRLSEAEHVRAELGARREDTRLFSERFTSASEQLGSEKAAVRLAGVYALASLADDWPAGRQTCIDVLCAYLRMPYRLRDTPPPEESSSPLHHDHTTAIPPMRGTSGHDPHEEHQVRLTVMRVIKAHLQRDSEVTWHGHRFDFSGAVFEGAEFDGANFYQCDVGFDHCYFYGESCFSDCRFVECRISFLGATVAGRLGFEVSYFEDCDFWLGADITSTGYVTFQSSEVVSGKIEFGGEILGGGLDMIGTWLKGGEVRISVRMTTGSVAFSRSTVSGGELTVNFQEMHGGEVYFNGMTVESGKVRFARSYSHPSNVVPLGGDVSFDGVDLAGGAVEIGGAFAANSVTHFVDFEMSGGTLSFKDVAFADGVLVFANSRASRGKITFEGASFANCAIDLSGLAIATGAVEVTNLPPSE